MAHSPLILRRCLASSTSSLVEAALSVSRMSLLSVDSCFILLKLQIICSGTHPSWLMRMRRYTSRQRLFTLK